ncbi:hypothetical protein C8Q78DRAFT_997289 [Trametes maxima]|nr:hypothetical protein C8Q78DRAFT_997289 [Trametes maxima]
MPLVGIIARGPTVFRRHPIPPPPYYYPTPRTSTPMSTDAVDQLPPSHGQSACPFCARAFKRKFHLSVHIHSVHMSDRRLFRCTNQGCGKAYYRRLDLRKHVVIKHRLSQENIKPTEPEELCIDSLRI